MVRNPKLITIYEHFLIFRFMKFYYCRFEYFVSFSSEKSRETNGQRHLYPQGHKWRLSRQAVQLKLNSWVCRCPSDLVLGFCEAINLDEFAKSDLPRYCEEQSDEAIQYFHVFTSFWIASLRSQ